MNPHILARNQSELAKKSFVAAFDSLFSREGDAIAFSDNQAANLKAAVSPGDCVFAHRKGIDLDDPNVKRFLKPDDPFTKIVLALNQPAIDAANESIDVAREEFNTTCILLKNVEVVHTGESFVAINSASRLVVDVDALRQIVLAVLDWGGMTPKVFGGRLQTLTQYQLFFLINPAEQMKMARARAVDRSTFEVLKAIRRFEELLMFVVRHEGVHAEQGHDTKIARAPTVDAKCAELQRVELQADVLAAQSMSRFRESRGMKQLLAVAPDVIGEHTGFELALRRIGNLHSRSSRIPGCVYPSLEVRLERIRNVLG